MLIGFFGFIAQVLLAMGLQRETASRGTLALYTQIIYTVILEWIFFKSTPSMLSICGTLIIITSALYVILTKRKIPTLSYSINRTNRRLRRAW
ncbi:hypothetical protein BD779DRAFT_899754 [Infundibulicybe gibba]|nr:hypothetical protein BD779DRAFT_899754 [Infundibulicybe gibba]